MDKNIFTKIFEKFVVLDSGIELLTNYLNDIDENMKEKYKRLIYIKKLAEKNLQTLILDDATLPALIREINQIYPINKSKVQLNKNSFKDILYEEDGPEDQKLLLNNFIYLSSIIYVDSIRDFPNPTETIFKIKHQDQSIKSIFSNAIDKPRIFLNRFQIIKHFLFQNGNFKTKFQKNSEGLEINSLDCLQGNSEEICVLGMIILNEEGKIQLQDERKVINLNIDETEWGKGYFTPGCIVLAQGVYKNEIFKVRAILHPMPVENKMTFREMYETDYFGAINKAFKNSNDHNENINKNRTKLIYGNVPYKMNVKTEETYLMNFIKNNNDLTLSKHLFPKNSENYIHVNYENLKKTSSTSNNLVDKIFNAIHEYLAEEFMLVISNVDITNETVLAGIEKIIQGYSNAENSTVPFMIVFMGNFISENSYNSYKILNTCFDNLANIIAKNQAIAKNTYLVFIPGPEDFSLFSGFPKFPLNDIIVNTLKKKLPNVIAATNPCRFTIFGKEFVFFRDNLNKTLSRNSIIKCNSEFNREYYIHTVMSQGYLSPVDLNTSARIWHLAHSMSIVPQPDYMILSDIVVDFVTKYNKTQILNPGSFTKDFSFYIIFPSKNVIEPCRVNM